MKTISKKELIEELKKIRDKGWIESGRQGNVGGIGNTLEDLLGIEENNLPIPNTVEWELKTQRLQTSSLITLFHMEPSPTALRFVPKVLLPKYGWAHKEAGKKHPSTEMSFRQTITGSYRSDRGFKVIVNRRKKQVLISFDADSVDLRHEKWLKSVRKRVGLGELDPQPYWGFDDLEHKAGSKIHNTFFVQAEKKKEDGIEYFRYSKITILQKFSFEGLLEGLEQGLVYVDFDARTGHNHGTKFRSHKDHFPQLFDKQTDI